MTEQAAETGGQGPPIEEHPVVPYELPDLDNHSFFFVDAALPPTLEAILHRHDAWELLCVTRGVGRRTAGDTTQDFATGEVALIPPMMIHRWRFSPGLCDQQGMVHYLMVAFRHSLVEQCMAVFPELRNRLASVTFPEHALHFAGDSARTLRTYLQAMRDQNELERLSTMLLLLADVFTASDRSLAGRTVRMEKNVQRIQTVYTYVMRHFAHKIRLEDVARETGMNRSAFCSWFRRCRGQTFSQYLTEYRLQTARDLLQNTDRQVSDICLATGFSDLPHFVRVFGKNFGMPLPVTARVWQKKKRKQAVSKTVRQTGVQAARKIVRPILCQILRQTSP